MANGKSDGDTTNEPSPGPQPPEAGRFGQYVRPMPQHGKTSENVADVLREAILEGHIQPSYWLRESEIARELSVSRTPVREALRSLAMEGLVDITTHQGAIVSSLTLDDILEVYVVRESLEGVAARLASKHRSEAQVQQLEELTEKMRQHSNDDARELARLNLDFHKVIRQATGNQFLNKFLTQIEHSVRRFGSTTFELPEWVEQSIEEHAKITRAIQNRDSETAEKLATEHMKHARQLRIRMLLEQ